jgi:3-phosphoshikimate 1-carboxyvinyltransferase
MLTSVPGSATARQVAPTRRLEGELVLPGDKSISHRALMLALLARGDSRIRGAGDGEDVRSTAGVVSALGATVARAPGSGGNVDYHVVSPGIDGLRAPSGPLDCGNSGTSLRLFAGILAGQPFEATLDGDASLRSRPMARIIEPLRAMGAEIDGADGAATPPLRVRGRSELEPVDWTTPVPSAQVKSAILLAGLRATGTTTVRESVATRDHTERMLRARGVPVRSEPSTEPGSVAVVQIDGGADVRAVDERVPGDPSAAAFWLVAGAAHPRAELRLRGVGTNPTRRAVVDLLRRMGASIEETALPVVDGGEPLADFVVRSSELRGISLDPGDTATAIDEIPILCLAATQAKGRTVIEGAQELRHKESDRIAGTVDALRTMGARITVEPGDVIVIDGPTRLDTGTLDALDDHRLAMTFAIAGLIASKPVTILGAESASISYPAFFNDLERIRS